MQIFEYYFNPKNDEGKRFKSLSYEPKKQSEKRLGSLYLIGETKTDNSNLVERLFKEIKERFYDSSFYSVQKSFPETSKRANEFLAEEVKKENVSWLGNLNCSIFSIKDSNLNFTKTGDSKVLLIRDKNIIDITKDVEKEDAENYPLKIFSNIVSGKITSGDFIITVSKDVFNFLKEKGILNNLANIENFDGKEIKNIFPNKLFTEEEGSKITGFCILFYIDTEDDKVFSKEFSFKEKFNKLDFLKDKKKKIKINKKFSIISFFIIILFLGFLIFKKEDNNIVNKDIINEEIEEKIVLYEDQKIEIIENLDPIFSLEENFEEIILLDKDIFVFSPYNKLYKIAENEKEKINLLDNFNSLSNSEKDIFLLSKEGYIFSLEEDKKIEIEKDFNLIKTYGQNLYLLNKENCNISKYNLTNNSTADWIKEKKTNQTCIDFAIDSSIFILNEEGLIDIYYQGEYKNSINAEHNIDKIKTSFDDPYIYMISKKGNRIIIIDKEGNLIKQIYSENFNDLKDISVMKEEKNILILNGDKIYKVDY